VGLLFVRRVDLSDGSFLGNLLNVQIRSPRLFLEMSPSAKPLKGFLMVCQRQCKSRHANRPCVRARDILILSSAEIGIAG
jgi:hypothetical protein